MSCATRCVAGLVLIFNLVFAIVGVAIVVLGILIQLDVINYMTPAAVSHEPLKHLPIIIICFGGVIIIVSLLGCFGVGKRGLKLLTAYIIILLVLFFLMICFGLYVLFHTNCELGLQTNIEAELKLMMFSYSNDTEVHGEIDTLQQKLHCCGVNSSSDWVKIPPSCCEENKQCEGGSSELFARGCSTLIFDLFVNAITVTYIMSFCVAALKIIGVIFAMLLVVSIRNDDRRQRHSQY